MNASAETFDSPRPHTVAAPHPTHTFKMLLKREFWEHKGGFLWAPLVAGGILLLLSLMGFALGEVTLRRAAGDGTISVDGGSVQINGLNLARLTEKMSPEDVRQLGGAIDLSLYMASAWPFIVLAFVVFFYCLGSLYDERRDRSVLFWKSLPVSDAQTVWSKVASAAVIAPVLAVAASLVTMIGFLCVTSLFVALHGGNPFTLLWAPASPLKIAGNLIASIPVYALWAMPTIGWLMLCSAWAKSKPFLWAIMIPLFAGIFVWWFGLMRVFELDTVWFWKNFVARALFSVAPVSWLDAAHLPVIHADGPEAVSSAINLGTMYSVLLTPQLWIGVVVGVAMIFASIRLRRWRDEG